MESPHGSLSARWGVWVQVKLFKSLESERVTTIPLSICVSYGPVLGRNCGRRARDELEFVLKSCKRTQERLQVLLEGCMSEGHQAQKRHLDGKSVKIRLFLFAIDCSKCCTTSSSNGAATLPPSSQMLIHKLRLGCS